MARYHLIPHSHWDREWYLTFDEFRAMLVHMIDDLIEIVDSDPDYRSFLLDGQTSVIDDYLEVRPENEEKLRALVQGGRLFVGPWYVLPDSFLVSGESLIRNLMIGTADAQEVGGSGFVGYIPDSFGHTAQIPQILRGFGLDTAIAWRGFGGEPGQEGSEYRWTAPDGSAVLMEHLHSGGYSEAYFPNADKDEVLDRFDAVRKKVDGRATTDVRLLLSGGDHHWPSKALPDAIRIVNEHIAPDRVVHSDLPSFFDDLKNEVDLGQIPIVDGEMRFGYRWAFNVTGGVYSARMYIKQANARCQRLLERFLEPLNALDVIRGGRSQRSLLRHGWKTLLQNHPHDSICGCSIDPVHREMMTRFEKVENLGKSVSRFAWMSLTDESEGKASDDQTLVIYNSTSVEREDPAECTIDFYRHDIVVGLNPDVKVAEELPPVEGFRIETADGDLVPFEILSQSVEHGIAHTRYNYPSQYMSERFRVAVQVPSVPALGFRMLRVIRQDGFATGVDGRLTTGKNFIANEFLRVETDSCGRVTVTDLENNREYGPIAVLEDGGDAGDEYNFSPPRNDEVLKSDVSEFQVTSKGHAFSAALEISGSFSVPRSFEESGHRRSAEQVSMRVKTTVTLQADSRLVRFRTEVENVASDHRLRVLFSTGCNTNQHSAESAFAVVERTQKTYNPEDFWIEVPTAVSAMQRFVTVEDEARAATIVSDGLPEYELVHDSGGVVALTLLRCVAQLSRDDLTMRPGGKSGWHNPTPEAQCHGVHVFDYGFLPHSAPAQKHDSLVQSETARFLEPLRSQSLKVDDMSLDGVFLANVFPESLTISAAKEAESGDGIIVRVSNPGPRTIRGSLTLGWNPTEVFESRLDETPIHQIPLDDARSISATWLPYQIKTFLIK